MAVSQGGGASTGNDGAGWWGVGPGVDNSKKQGRAAATEVLRIATGDHKRGGTSAVNMSTATVGVTHQLMAKNVQNEASPGEAPNAEQSSDVDGAERGVTEVLQGSPRGPENSVGSDVERP